MVGFSITPVFFGSIMALIDIIMMSAIKMVSLKTIKWSIGVPIAVILYGLEPLIFLNAMSYEGMVVTNLVWNLMSNIIVTLQGVLLFGENIRGLRWVGIAMSLLALTILSLTES